MSKGSKRRQENYQSILANWDKIFGYNEDDPDFFKYHAHTYPTAICSHKINPESLICEFCGKTESDILNDGDSWYMN